MLSLLNPEVASFTRLRWGGFMIKQSMLINMLITIFLSAGFFVNAQNIPYKDTDFNCFTQAEANRYVKDYNVDVESFGGMELCDAQVDTKKLLNDLLIIEKGLFVETATTNPFIKSFVDSKNYYSWMKSQTRGVKRGQDVPYATAYNSGGYFTMQDGWAKLSTLGRVGTVIHEARHTAGYSHIPCNQGTYQGSSVAGCDRNYSYGGSHAVEMEYYARVAVQGQNFHPVYKKMARLMAIARSNIFFNTPIIQTREAVLALSADRQSSKLFDKGEWVDREVPFVDGRLKRTSFGAVIFNGAQALTIELYQNSGFADLITDTYSYFKLLLEVQQPVKDFEEFDEGSKRFVVKITADNKLVPYDFPNGQWGREVSLPFAVLQISKSVIGQSLPGLYLISTSGEIYNYQGTTKKLTKLNVLWNTDDQEVVTYKGQNLVLKTNGQILVSKTTGFEPWTETRDTAFAGLVTVPVYDGFEVVK